MIDDIIHDSRLTAEPINADCSQWIEKMSLSLLSIVSNDDISVGVRPVRALLVGERIVQFEI